ncbi:MAG: hypothetical protein M1836_007942 [Candelina mexicana]|nr:MAG: hypothetical protein M1836_007942 [Candelina mexicana]
MGDKEVAHLLEARSRARQNDQNNEEIGKTQSIMRVQVVEPPRPTAEEIIAETLIVTITEKSLFTFKLQDYCTAATLDAYVQQSVASACIS